MRTMMKILLMKQSKCMNSLKLFYSKYDGKQIFFVSNLNNCVYNFGPNFLNKSVFRSLSTQTFMKCSTEAVLIRSLPISRRLISTNLSALSGHHCCHSHRLITIDHSKQNTFNDNFKHENRNKTVSGSNSAIKNEKLKLQFIQDYLNSSQDLNLNQSAPEASFCEQDIVKEPPRERFGVLKAMIIIVSGIYFGAWLAMISAKLLEDLEIFVQNDDDTDDNDD
ncbi:1-phosphatidylinositol-4 5-bisphosphate phosphodiesterase [Sarcoptes scabiei]|nr:1-phosphatidylinositol-4 5-bisphosphate phosphodiesterase [Sarcoptes scabiei]